MTKPTKQSYSFEFKLALVERFLAGETAQDLAAEADLSSPLLTENVGCVCIVARARTPCARSLKADLGSPRPHRRRSHPSWSGCAGKTNGCGQKWPTWENYGP